MPTWNISSWVKKHKAISAIFFSFLLALGLFLMLSPFFPEVLFWSQKWSKGESFSEESIIESNDLLSNSNGDEGQEVNYLDNWLLIPAIGLDVEIVEGESDEALNYGAWRRPNSSTPEKGGNTVVTGHRFRYLPPNNLTFYHLDKLVKDDEIAVYWEGEKYLYKVDQIFEVDPDAIEVEANTDEAQLTLYTCTPLWTAAKRLVIIAKLQSL